MRQLDPCPAGQLDFPPVELTAGESEAKVRFQNPLRFYEELNRIEWDEDVVFKYSVRTQRVSRFTPVDCDDDVRLTNVSGFQNPNGSVASCRKNQPDCTSSVPLSEGEEPSVRLEGRLCTRDCLREVGFRATGPIFQNNGASKSGFESFVNVYSSPEPNRVLLCV